MEENELEKIFDQVLSENSSLLEEYRIISLLLGSIALKIDEYIEFCGLGDTEDWKSLKESEDGNHIITAIKSYFRSLHRRLFEWGKITLGITNHRDIDMINEYTEETDGNSDKVYKSRVNIYDPNRAIFQIEDSEKEVIKDLCDNYFVNLKELNDLLDPFVKQNQKLNNVWPFKETDDTNKRNNILNWLTVIE